MKHVTNHFKLILSQQYEASQYGNVCRNSSTLSNGNANGWQYVKASCLSKNGFDKHYFCKTSMLTQNYSHFIIAEVLKEFVDDMHVMHM